MTGTCTGRKESKTWIDEREMKRNFRGQIVRKETLPKGLGNEGRKGSPEVIMGYTRVRGLESDKRDQQREK